MNNKRTYNKEDNNQENDNSEVEHFGSTLTEESDESFQSEPSNNYSEKMKIKKYTLTFHEINREIRRIRKIVFTTLTVLWTFVSVHTYANWPYLLFRKLGSFRWFILIIQHHNSLKLSRRLESTRPKVSHANRKSALKMIAQEDVSGDQQRMIGRWGAMFPAYS